MSKKLGEFAEYIIFIFVPYVVFVFTVQK